MKLNEISDNKGARQARKRRGRGIGSGLGKTGGRGHKGQKSRSGVALKGFEGGQMPLYRRVPKRGFNNIFRRQWTVVNLGDLQRALEQKKITPNTPITAEAMQAAGLTRRALPVRLLGKGTLSTKIVLEVAATSQAARAAVEAQGGEILLKPFDHKKTALQDKTKHWRKTKRIENKKTSDAAKKTPSSAPASAPAS